MNVLSRRLAAFLLFFTTLLFAQEKPGATRPKIGLVLGGGGARGLAHIGVLEWLEEHRIPVDYIAGTSMGGLMGGLYAMGMTPAQIRTLIAGIDWEQLLRGNAPYEHLLLRRKQDHREFPGLRFGWNSGFRLSAGLNGGHFVSLILARAAAPYWQVRDFDALPIPFRCVAADLVTAKPVVLGDGAIAEAMRATMAIPGVFTPVQRGSALLIDGGVFNNVPTDVVKEMGAGVIIAVNVGTPLRPRKGLQSMVGILDQTSSLASAESVRKNLLLANVVLTPELGDYTAASFTAGEALAKAGYAAAAAHESELRRFELGERDWERHSDAVRLRVRREVPVPQSLVVEAPTPGAAGAIRERLEHHRGKTLRAETLEDDLTKLLGWGRYSSLSYELRASGDPSLGPELVVRAEPFANGATIIRAGLGVQGAQTQEVEVNLLARATAFDLGGYGSELRVDASLGTTLLYGMEYYRPIGKSRFFVAPHAFASRSTTNVSATRDNVATYRRSSAGAGIDLGYGVLSRTDEVRLGYEIRYDDSSVVVGSPILPAYHGSTNVVSLRWFHEGTDSASIPRRGIRSTVRGGWFLDSATSARDFPQAEFKVSGFHPVSERGALFAMAVGGTTFNRTAPLDQVFILGGPLQLSSYSPYELRGSDYALAGAGYLRRMNQSSLAKLYAVGIVQAGRVFHPRSADRTGMDVTAGVAADTIIGPILVGFAVGDAGHRKAFIAIGRTF